MGLSTSPPSPAGGKEPLSWGSKCCSCSSHLPPHTADGDIVPSELGLGTCWCEFSRLSLLNRGLCSSSQEEEGEGAGTGTPLSRPQQLSQVSSKTYVETLWLAGMALRGKWQGRLGGPFSTQCPTLPSDCLLSRALLPNVPSSGLTVQTKEWLCKMVH